MLRGPGRDRWEVNVGTRDRRGGSRTPADEDEDREEEAEEEVVANVDVVGAREKEGMRSKDMFDAVDVDEVKDE